MTNFLTDDFLLGFSIQAVIPNLTYLNEIKNDFIE